MAIWQSKTFFWAAAILPMALGPAISDLLCAYWFCTFLIIYILIYRPLINIFRLLSLSVIKEESAWRFFIPFHHTRYMKDLWLK